jgi:adenylate cyclase
MPEPAGGAAIERRVVLALSVALIGANLIGAAVGFVLLAWILPLPPVDDPGAAQRLNAIVLVAALAVAVPGGFWWSARRLAPWTRWLREDGHPDPAEQHVALRAPLRLLVVQATLWALLRPVTERALAHGVPDEPAVPGVAARVLLAWGLSTAAPILGLALVGGVQMVGISEGSSDRLATTIVFLGAIALAAGLAGMTLVARSVADPIERVRHALAAVGAGRTDVEVPVTDGSEVGLLQAGFNRMVAGLREREKLRDLFGRQVGEDVARQALDRGVELGGEERDVGVLFIDLVGSTRLASECPPAEVVALLNAFFGAPLEREDAAGDALAAARALRQRLGDALPQADFGIGVSAGAAVAGNIGAAERFEYTVIGDPVNEAARLTDLAKADAGRVLASGTAHERARETESALWGMMHGCRSSSSTRSRERWT